MDKSKVARARTRKPIQAFAFVDTNIFLDFYRSRNEANLSLLEKLKAVKDRILSTYQVEMEFLKNRQDVLLGALRDFSADVSTTIPAVVADAKLQAALTSLKNDTKRKRAQLQKRVISILKNPKAHDRVYGVLAEIFASSAAHVLTRDMPERHRIKRKALRRFVLGYPPRKDRDTAIGDALNWEWIVHCSTQLSGRIIIVSRDGDYGCEINGNYFLNDELKAEFRDRVGNKSIVFTKRLSEALRALEVPVTKKEEAAEESALGSVASAAQSGAASDAAWSAVSYMSTASVDAQLRQAMRSLTGASSEAQLQAAGDALRPRDYSADFRAALQSIATRDLSADIIAAFWKWVAAPQDQPRSNGPPPDDPDDGGTPQADNDKANRLAGTDP